MSHTIKSAARVLEIFELFETLRRRASQAEIARALGAPQSSTSMLLRNLVALGYLTHDPARRSFMPTSRLTLLGTWVAPQPEPGTAIDTVMHDLGSATGGTIILGMLAGSMVRYIRVLPATTAMRLHVNAGTTRPLATSGIGRVFMAQMEPERVREIVHQHNAGAASDEACVSLASVMRDLAAIRAKGYAVSLGRVTRDAGVVAVPIDVDAYESPMAMGIGGLSETIQAAAPAWAALMRHALSHGKPL